MMENFHTEITDGICIIKVPRRLNSENSEYLKKMLQQNTETEMYKIVLDLQNTVYVDSSGLGAIVSTIAVTRANSGDIRLAHVAQNILDLLEITHLNKVLKCYSSLEEGLQSFIHD